MTLHTHSVQRKARPDFGSAVGYARRLVGQLSNSGILRNNPVVRDGALRLIDRWATRTEMADFVPTFIHGDATTANFSLAEGGNVIGIDWERLHIADPADDLGRLMAEVSHSIVQYGGDLAEAERLIEHMAESYGQALPSDWDADALLRRVRFYRAVSTLRIARNDWIKEQDRFALVAESLALLG